MTSEAITSAIPHRPPFLLIDEIVEQSEDAILCRKTFRSDEFWYQGHYPEEPITPGVLLCEAAMQAGAVLLSKKVPADSTGVPVATRINNVQFKRIVRPDETVDISVELTDQLANAFFMKARVTVDNKVACRFDFACTLAEQPSAGQ